MVTNISRYRMTISGWDMLTLPSSQQFCETPTVPSALPTLQTISPHSATVSVTPTASSAPPTLQTISIEGSATMSGMGSALSNLSTASSNSIEHFIDKDITIPPAPCITPQEQ